MTQRVRRTGSRSLRVLAVAAGMLSIVATAPLALAIDLGDAAGGLQKGAAAADAAQGATDNPAGTVDTLKGAAATGSNTAIDEAAKGASVGAATKKGGAAALQEVVGGPKKKAADAAGQAPGNLGAGEDAPEKAPDE